MNNRFLKVSLALMTMVGLTTITGCKKGENDPFLSLKTRKGRITGEWKLVEGTIVESETIGGSTVSSEITFIDDTRTEGGSSIPYVETMAIERDGTYEHEIIQNGTPHIIQGDWYFSGKNENIDLKKKEAIVFSETEYVNIGGTITYNGLGADRILLMDQLKNKRVVFKGLTTGISSSGEGASYAYDLTFEKQ
jgi:hypothetical protein